MRRPTALQAVIQSNYELFAVGLLQVAARSTSRGFVVAWTGCCTQAGGLRAVRVPELGPKYSAEVDPSVSQGEARIDSGLGSGWTATCWPGHSGIVQTSNSMSISPHFAKRTASDLHAVSVKNSKVASVPTLCSPLRIVAVTVVTSLGRSVANGLVMPPGSKNPSTRQTRGPRSRSSSSATGPNPPNCHLRLRFVSLDGPRTKPKDTLIH